VTDPKNTQDKPEDTDPKEPYYPPAWVLGLVLGLLYLGLHYLLT
jgi:quinol-cytochrome oxidoreductase complex cytochrome b subunit